MLTMNCIIKQKYPIDKPLTDELLKELIKENSDKNYSYLTLLREYINVTNPITVRDLLSGYSSIKLFTIN